MAAQARASLTCRCTLQVFCAAKAKTGMAYPARRAKFGVLLLGMGAGISCLLASAQHYEVPAMPPKDDCVRGKVLYRCLAHRAGMIVLPWPFGELILRHQNEASNSTNPGFP